MATPVQNTCRRSLAMERTGQWVFSQEIPADILVVVREAHFNLHKFMLVAKSNYIRKMILDSKETDLSSIDLSDIPGGPEIFEKAAKFCYGVNFEITVDNVAALRCAAEYLEMTDDYCENNLANRTEDFLNQVALTTLSGAVIVLKACHCQDLLPMAEDVNIVQKCIGVISSKACCEASFPTRIPTNWWAEELAVLDIISFQKIIAAMKSRGAKILTISSAIIAFTENCLRDLVRDHSGGTSTPKFPALGDPVSDIRIQQCQLLESLVTIFPSEKAAFPINFLCSLLRCAIFLKPSNTCKNELERRISDILEHVTVDDLLVLSFTYDGEGLFDLESVRRIISSFVTKEKSVGVFNGGGNYREVCSVAVQRVAKTLDAYLGEIATSQGLSISKFNGIANLVPKGARKVDDDLYRAIDIYLKAHPNLDEIEREKVCSALDPLKLSYDARVHASQNKRLPVQIVLHALYYDKLKLRSGDDHHPNNNAITVPADTMTTVRGQLQADVSLMKENEALKSELMKMKMYVSTLQKNNPGTSSKTGGHPKKTTFFSSMSRTLGKLNPFKHGSKDTSNIDDDVVDITKPRRRRFSVS